MSSHIVIRAAVCAGVLCFAPVRISFAQNAIKSISRLSEGDLLSAKNAIENKDYSKALLILEKLTESKNADAAFYIGMMYKDGIGVKRNNITASKYYKYSYIFGNTNSIDYLKLSDETYYPGRIYKENYEINSQMKCPSSGMLLSDMASGNYQWSDIWKFDGTNVSNSNDGLALDTKLYVENHVQKFGLFIFDFSKKIIFDKHRKVIINCE